MLLLGNASGHDFQFHLASWLDVAGQWHEGIAFPRWAEWANWGFGEPRFIFYPPASWMFGAALGSVLPWKMAPGAFIWLALVLAGISMWCFAREWLSRHEAVMAAVLYAVNPYHLVFVYLRSDFAELIECARHDVASLRNHNQRTFAVIQCGTQSGHPHAPRSIGGNLHHPALAETQIAQRGEDARMRLVAETNGDGRRPEESVGFDIPACAAQ